MSNNVMIPAIGGAFSAGVTNSAFAPFQGEDPPELTPQYKAILAAYDPHPSTDRQQIDDAFVRSMVDSGFYAKLDAIYLPPTDSDQNQMVNWADPSTPFVKTGTVTRADNFYAYGDGTTGWVAAPVPNGSGNLQRNDACIIFYQFEDQVSTTSSCGADKQLFNPHNTANSIRVRICMGTTDIPTLSGGIGAALCMVRRTSATEYEVWKWNEKVLTRTTSNSATIASEDISGVTQPFAFHGWQQVGTDLFDTRKISHVAFGAAPTDEQWAAYCDAFQQWLTNIGALVQPRYVVIANAKDTSFDVDVDLPGTGVGATVQVQISTSSTFASVLATESATATLLEGVAEDYAHAKVSFTGLTAGTVYYVRVVTNTISEPPVTRSVRTLPATGTAAAFSLLFSSCAKFDRPNIAPARQARTLVSTYAASAPVAAFFLCGDLAYDNYVSSDIRGKRDVFVRTLMANTSMRELSNVVPFLLTVDDHDMGKNDGQWLAASYDYPDVSADARQVLSESYPNPEYPDARSLYFEREWAGVKVVCLDTRSQRIGPNGLANSAGVAPLMIGNGVAQPSYSNYDPPDDEQNIKDAATAWAAGPNADKIFVIVSPTTLNGDANGGWQTVPEWEDQWVRICNHIHPLGLRVLVLVGDAHANGVDDGTYTNRATVAGTTKWAQAMCSAFFNSSTLPLPTLSDGVTVPYVWDGASGAVGDSTTSGQSLLHVRFSADNTNAILDYWTKPAIGSTALTLAASFDTADIW